MNQISITDASEIEEANCKLQKLLMEFKSAYEEMPWFPGMETRYHAVYAACDFAMIADDKISETVADDMRREGPLALMAIRNRQDAARKEAA